MYYYMFKEHSNNTCVYINVNVLKQNKLNEDHQEINMRAFNWNLKNFCVFVYIIFIQKKQMKML